LWLASYELKTQNKQLFS